jgi:phosphate transport system substrate-binding protein
VKPVFLGAYRLIAKLGRGRVTDVYLATRDGQSTKGDLVVIKRLRVGKNEEVPISTDAELATRLRHPNIATTFEMNQEGTAPYWAMEYVDGQPLDRVLSAANRSGGLPVSYGLRVLCDLLAALEYAHSLSDDTGRPLGIVHRDVRPHNIFVSYQGELKLLDFGVPRPPVTASTTSEGGGRAYVAPEQAMSGSVDRRSDIFAVGLVMWELLSKQRRLNPDVPVGTLHGLQPEITTEQGSIDSAVSAELSRINDRALERDPDKRYASAEEMRLELEAALEKLGDPRCATATMARANLGSSLQRLFKTERTDAARRIQLLLAVDSLAPTGSLDDAPAATTRPGVNGVQPPPLRITQADAQPRVSAPPPPPKRDKPPATRPEASEPRLAHSVAPSPVRPDNHGSPRVTEGRGVAAVAAVLLVLAAVGLTWSMTRPAPKQETATAAIASKPEPVATSVLKLCGSNTIGAELAPALIEALFASKDSSAKLSHRRNIDSDVTQLLSRTEDKAHSAEVTARGTATGFAGLAEGSCDVAMASRAISPDEVTRLKDKGLGDLSSAANEHVVALDGVAVVVHPNNPLGSLDRNALHAIFTGKLTDWSEVGGAAGPIHVVARDDQSGTFDTFHHLVLGDDKLVADAKRYVRSDALADAVASDPAAIGFVGLAYVRTAKALAVGEPGALPLLPTQFTVATEGYMLSRRLYFYTPDKPSSPWVTELVNFAMSPRGQEIAAKAGFVNLSLLTENVRCGTDCPERYRATVDRAQRISVDLRFRSASNLPDSRALRDLDRLVKFLQNFRETRVLLLGFSDSVGGPNHNLRLSNERAKTIADELLKRGVHAATVTGFGAEMPVASNDSELGRDRNRRVEVWFEHL